jgi:hypothetical protein
MSAGGRTMTDAIAAPNTRTLFDDWKARREQLLGTSGGKADYRAVEIRLLDYLMHRYKDSPEASRPALFPLSSGVFVDHRAIVVHHHLGRGSIPTISNRQQAYAHVRSMVEQMWTADTGEEAADGTPAFVKPVEADPVEAVRELLCDGDPTARVQAALRLGEIGTLDDIGLLSDLLSLPYSRDEHPKERAALLHAMKRLSGATDEKFDATDIAEEPPGDFVPAGLETAPLAESPRERLLINVLFVWALIFFSVGVAFFIATFFLP